MKKKLVIHIGAHKTGTTFLQSSFSHNPDTLNELGVLYPKSGRRYDAHHPLAWSIKSTSGQSGSLFDLEDWNGFHDECMRSEHNTIFISSEDFEWIPNISALEVLREHFEIKVLFYMRAADTYVESYYNQIVKDFGTKEDRTIEEYLSEESLFFLDVYRILDRWQKLFGPEAIILRRFDRSTFPNGSLISDTLKAIGVKQTNSFAEPPIDYVQKTSLSPDPLEYLRYMNMHLVDGTGHHNFVRDLVRLSLQHKDKLNECRAGLLSMKAKLNVINRFNDSYRKASNTFLGINENPFPSNLATPHANFDSRPATGTTEIFAKIAALIRNNQTT